MFCTECGTKVNEDSKFCDNCGHQLTYDEPKAEEEKEQPKSEKRTYWDKFVEVYSSEDTEWKDKMISDAVWELLNRFAANTFVDFIEQNKALNKRSHKEVASIKGEFTTASGAGYYFWLAEQLFNNEDLKPAKPPDTDELAKEWGKSNVFGDAQNFFGNIPNMVSNSMNDFYAWRLKSLLEESPSLNDLPNELVEEIKSKLAILMLMGYSAAVLENKYRK